MLKIRPLMAEDEPLVSSWLEQDETHRKLGLKWKDVVAPGTHAVIVSDEDDVILYVIRYHLALRAAVQFNPTTAYRNAKHGVELRELLQEHAREEDTIEVIIRPGGGAIRFADKMGFKDFSGSKMLGV